jgi:vesicle transport protein SEC22
MAAFTLVSRLADGLPLCQSTDPQLLATSQVSDTISQQARSVVAGLSARSDPRGQVEAGEHSLCYLCAPDDNLVLLVALADKAFPRRLAFAFLADLHTAFLGDLRAEQRLQLAGSAGAAAGAGATAGSVIDVADRPYSLQRFDRTLIRLRREYADPKSKSNADRLKDELTDIRSIMRKSINEVLDRGEKLEHVSRISSKLVSESKKFRWGAKRLNILDAWKNAAPYAIVAAVVLGGLYWRFGGAFSFLLSLVWR